MSGFQRVEARAAKRKGGAAALEKLLPVPAQRETLVALSGERVLEEMARRVFQAGFVWRIVQNKWPGICDALRGFDPVALAHLSDEAIEGLLSDSRLIRNHQKLKAIRHNAAFVLEIEDACGSFGAWLADWPTSDMVGLHRELARRGSRLGGLSGQFFLRGVGRDTFVLSNDTVAALVRERVVDRRPTSRQALADVQHAFDAWCESTGRPMCQVSAILSMSVD
jgi:3-methyladenine DNA glycosylase Tag